jgi:RNA polymerase sigma factor (sigma-70 family)
MVTTLDEHSQHLLRDLAPRVLGRLARRYQHFPGCEDAVQEALLAAAQQWPGAGIPESPVAWLLHVASRRLTDEIRSDTARRHRESLVVSLIPPDEQIALAVDSTTTERDDSLDLFFMCCHPALSQTSQVALTLRAVGGLTTAEIARAFHVPEATMAQRISRAKQTIQSSGVGFEPIAPEHRRDRLPAVLHVLYLVFSEGYAATSGESVTRLDLSTEAIRVTRLLDDCSDDPEVTGLLALMLLTDARRDARTGPNGELVPLDSQDRTRWNRPMIRNGVALLDRAMTLGAPGPYQIQAAIAALHDEATSTDTTDWVQILALYAALLRVADSPMARLSHAIALAMVEGPGAGLAALDGLAREPRFEHSHRLDAVRGHLCERAGDVTTAVACYRRAAGRTASLPERNYLLVQAARLAERSTP